MNIQGLHHITLGCSDAQRTIRFYTEVLGLRMIKLTVNFDDPDMYHIYFGDERGSPGTAITFFEWPGVPRGSVGIGGTHHVALQVRDASALLKWKRRLEGLGIQVTGPIDRRYFTSLSFQDPDGTQLEIATLGPGWDGSNAGEPTELSDSQEGDTEIVTMPTSISPDMSLAGGMHHVTVLSSDLARTNAFYGDLLGMRRIEAQEEYDELGGRHWIWGAPDLQPGGVVSAIEMPPGTRRARMGVGQTHHFALAVDDENTQRVWRERLIQAGTSVSPVMERVYFKSVYTRDPDGHIVELATLGPGFTADESLDALGSALMLPPWHEPRRREIEAMLKPVKLITREAA
jgi:glyoxalase family protein